MVTRREFTLYSLAAATGVAALPSCSLGESAYEAAARATWRHGDRGSKEKQALMHELVRYATLAPSSHNTQCWMFRNGADAVTILPDFSRRCGVVDPDDHHLFVSLGCAAENLIQAALAHGLHGEPVVGSEGQSIRVALEATKPVVTPLFEAIPERQSTRGEYDGRPLSSEELGLLEKAGTGNGVRVILLTERQAMERVLEYVTQGNTAQMTDPAFTAELKSWIRFSGAEAVRSRDGLYGACSGNPSVPDWIGGILFDMFFTPAGENEKYARQMRSSAGVAVFVSDLPSAAQWIEVGRCYERFALQSAALGIRNAFLNQPVEVGTLRPQFAAWLGIGNRRPDLVVRFGRGPKLPPSLRRPVPAVSI